MEISTTHIHFIFTNIHLLSAHDALEEWSIHLLKIKKRLITSKFTAKTFEDEHTTLTFVNRNHSVLQWKKNHCGHFDDYPVMIKKK